MVDFRYHIVSLVAVFLALAVGIILGAGPLQNSIGDTLSGEVDSLREANGELKQVNEQLNNEQKQYTAAFEQLAPSLLAGTLNEQSVALITFADTSAGDIEKFQHQLALSGAKINGVFEIQKDWTDSQSTAYRSSFAEQIKAYVPDAKDVSDTNTIMALALNQLVRGGLSTEANKTLGELMTAADTVMLKVREGGNEASTAVVFLSPDTPDLTPKKDTTQDPDKVAQADYDAKTYGALVGTVSAKSPVVLSGYANSQNDLVTLARTSGIAVSTVDSLGGPLGATNTVLAIAAELNEKKVAYGFADGVDAVVGSRIVVAVPAPAPAEAAPAPAA